MSILVVGGGRWGKVHARTLIEMEELYGVEDVRDDALFPLQDQFGGSIVHTIDATYRWVPDTNHKEPPEGVVVATPSFSHGWEARRWLNRGIPALVEKPVACTLSDLNGFASFPTDSLMAGHLLVFSPQYSKLKEILDGTKENVLSINFVRRKNSPNREEGVFLSLAVHDIALADYLLSGIEYCSGEVIHNATNTTAMASLRCRALNRMVTLNGLWSFDIGIPKREVVVVTNDATYIVLEGKSLTSFSRSEDGLVVRADYTTSTTPPLTLELEHFIQGIRQGREFLTGRDHIFRTYSVVFNALGV